MRKSLFVTVIIITVVIVVSFFASCKQCNHHATDIEKTDSTSIPDLEKMNEAIKQDSLNGFLYYKRAQLFEANKDYEKASQDMLHALQLDSLRPEFYLYAAELFKYSTEPQRGVLLMQAAIATDSMNTAYYVKAAELAFMVDKARGGNYIVPMNFLNAAIEKDPQNSDIYYFKGNIFKEIGDTIRALSSFQTATELNPKDYNSFLQIGLLLKHKKDKNAEKYLNNAIKVSDKPIDALYAKANIDKEEGVVLYDKQKYPEAVKKLSFAIEGYKKIIELDYKEAEAYVAIGFCYYQMDSVEEAYNFYDKALKLEPTHALAYFSKGLCAEDLGRKKEAITLYQNCLNIAPDFERAQEHLEKLEKAQ